MEELLKQILNELHTLNNRAGGLEQGQEAMNARLTNLEKEIARIKVTTRRIKHELRYVWEDIKRLSNRLKNQEDEIVMLKRLK